MAQNAATTVLSINPKFATSVSQASEYPLNVVQKQTYLATIRAYNQRLTEESPRIFEDVPTEINVPIHDFDETTKRR